MEIVGTGKRRVIGLLFLGLLVLFLLSIKLGTETTSIADSKEWALQEDVLTMRYLVDQYTLDQHKRPSSLGDLVEAGYLKRLPIDPTTGRRDTWVVEWSADPQSPGIEDIQGGAKTTGKRALLRLLR